MRRDEEQMVYLRNLVKSINLPCYFSHCLCQNTPIDLVFNRNPKPAYCFNNASLKQSPKLSRQLQINVLRFTVTRQQGQQEQFSSQVWNHFMEMIKQNHQYPQMPLKDWRFYVDSNLLDYKFTDERINTIQMIIKIKKEFIAQLGLMKWVSHTSGEQGYIQSAEIFSLIYGKLMLSVMKWKDNYYTGRPFNKACITIEALALKSL